MKTSSYAKQVGITYRNINTEQLRLINYEKEYKRLKKLEKFLKQVNNYQVIHLLNRICWETSAVESEIDNIKTRIMYYKNTNSYKMPLG